MPASMISAAVGGRWKVMGSSMAMVATGPMPGRTPIRVPTMQPTKAYSRFWSESATFIPRTRLPSRSMSPDPVDDGDVHLQSDLEHEHAEDRQHDDVEGHFPELEFVAT